jgi:hypothetical protein
MRSLVFALLIALAPASAQAQGFATRDLASVQAAVTDALGSGYLVRTEPHRLALTCPGCADEPILGLEIGRQADGTEQRVRSGVTGIDDLERLCQARDPDCRLSALDVAPAVGWVSSYRIGSRAGATAVLIRDGDLLTIRSLAGDAATARRGIDTLLPVVRARIIGN